MKTIKRNRYYCDHCGKGGGSAGHIRKHELHCTANPQRECRMCKMAGKTQIDTTTLAAVATGAACEVVGGMSPEMDYGLALTKEGMYTLREYAGNCPACILSALRQAKVCGDSEWNFAAESKAWFEEHIQARRRFDGVCE